MLQASVLFFVLALFAIFFGAYGFAGVSIDAGRLLLGAFLVLAIINLIASAVTGSRTRLP